MSESGGVNAVTNATIAGLGIYQGYQDLKDAYTQLGSEDGLGFTLDLSLGISHQQSSSSSTVSAPVVTDSAGVGVGFSCSLKGKCQDTGVTVRGSYGKGGAETDGVTHYNSHVDGTGDVMLNADGVAIRGGTVAGNSVTVDANSLTIESQVDTAKAKADQLNVSASVGSDSFNVSGVTQNAKGDAVTLPPSFIQF